MEDLTAIFVIPLLTIAAFHIIFSRRLKNHHSNWNTLVDDFQYPTVDFYKLLKEELKATQVKGFSYSEANLWEGLNVVSYRRKYLRVTWKEYQFDVCAAPFGRGMFFSWWLVYKHSLAEILIGKIPYIGWWIVRKLFPVTYYKIDTASMFMAYAQTAVLNVIDHISNEKGARILTESERKPILNDINLR